MSVWFVTPAWQRFDLTTLCLRQRHRIIIELAAHGIEANCVVVGDDANLDMAQSLGFHTVEQNNEWLGRKFNDGMEYAAAQDAEWIVPIGSDSWIDPAYFLPLPKPTVTRTSHMYAPVELDRLAELNVGRYGAGPYMFHRSLLEPCGFRPAKDEISRYIDSSTIAGIGHFINWEFRDIHPLQYVGFRQAPLITPYDRLWKAWGVTERTDPWERLAKVYPEYLVDHVRRVMQSSESLASEEHVSA